MISYFIKEDNNKEGEEMRHLWLNDSHRRDRMSERQGQKRLSSSSSRMAFYELLRSAFLFPRVSTAVEVL